MNTQKNYKLSRIAISMVIILSMLTLPPLSNTMLYLDVYAESNNQITLESYNQITTGMTKSDVEAIVGNEGKVIQGGISFEGSSESNDAIKTVNILLSDDLVTEKRIWYNFTKKNGVCQYTGSSKKVKVPR